MVYFGQYGASDFTIHKDEARKIDTFYAMRKMNLNFGINQELTLLHFGVDFIYGRCQRNKLHTST